MIFKVASFLLLSALLCAQDTLNQAWNLAASGSSQEAMRILNVLVQKEPGNADARLLLGSLLMEANQGAASIENLTAAVRLRPRSFEAENALGEAYVKFGRPKDARIAFEKAVALKPGYGIAQSNLGQTLLSLNDPTAAAKHLDLAIPLLGDSDDAADALYLRAKLYLAQGEAEEARSRLQKALKIRPKFAEAWSDLGQANKDLLDDVGALAAFQRAVEENPQDAVAQYRLGAQYLAGGDSHLAVDCLKKARQLNPSDQSTLNSLQMALRQDGKPEEAATVKKQLADLLRAKDTVNQDHLAAVKLNNEGAQLEKSGDLTAAVALYSKAASLYKEHSGIHFNYGVALLRLGKWTAGLNELHTALEQDPDNAKLKATFSDALSQAPRELVPKWPENKP